MRAIGSEIPEVLAGSGTAAGGFDDAAVRSDATPSDSSQVSGVLRDIASGFSNVSGLRHHASGGIAPARAQIGRNASAFSYGSAAREASPASPGHVEVVTKRQASGTAYPIASRGWLSGPRSRSDGPILRIASGFPNLIAPSFPLGASPRSSRAVSRRSPTRRASACSRS